MFEVLQGKRVLVTAGAGFIGANMVRWLLDKKADVVATVRKTSDLWRLTEIADQIELVYLDLTDTEEVYQTIKAINPEIIYHTAESKEHLDNEEDFRKTVNDCILMMTNLLEASKDIGLESFIHAGSSLEYGESVDVMKETLPMKPSSWRGVCKATEHAICHFYVQSFNFPVVAVRIFRAYGPWEQPNRLMLRLIKCFEKGEAISLVDEKYKKDFVFVEDVVEGMVRASLAKLNPGTILNLGYGAQHSCQDVVSIMQGFFERNLTFDTNYPTKQADQTSYQADMTITRKSLGWSPSIPLEEGIKKVLGWYEVNKSEVHHLIP